MWFLTSITTLSYYTTFSLYLYTINAFTFTMIHGVYKSYIRLFHTDIQLAIANFQYHNLLNQWLIINDNSLCACTWMIHKCWANIYTQSVISFESYKLASVIKLKSLMSRWMTRLSFYRNLFTLSWNDLCIDKLRFFWNYIQMSHCWH